MKSKTIKTMMLTAIVALAAYWYWSPFLVVRQLQLAAQNRDAEALSEHVDFQKLRESIKNQYSDRLAVKFGHRADSDNEFATLGAALGSMIGKAVVSPIVDAFIRPDAVMQAVQYGRLAITEPSQRSSDTPTQTTDRPSGRSGNAPKNEDGKVKWSFERKGVDKVIAYAIDPQRPDGRDQDKFALVLQRSGFATWKLVGVQLPEMNK